MKQSVKAILQYLPWLLLMLGVDAFAALFLWLANIQAFYSMAAVILLATFLYFFAVCFVLIRLDRKRKQAFSDFLHIPDEYHEEALLKTVNAAQKESVRLLGRHLRDQQAAYARLQMQVSDQEEYVES